MAYQDVMEAIDIAHNKTASIGADEDDWLKARKALESYGEKRDSLFGYMVQLLDPDKSLDTSDLVSKWKDYSGKGIELLEELNRTIPKSETGEEGLKGVGLAGFAEGEKNNWATSKDAIVGYTTDAMYDILKADLALIKESEEDLKAVRDGVHEVESIFLETFVSMKSVALEYSRMLAIKVASTYFKHWVLDPDAKIKTTILQQELERRVKINVETATKKAWIQQIVLRRIQVLEKVREQLAEDSIERLFSKGADFVKSLSSTSGDYNAKDWKQLASDCIEQLKKRRERITAESKKLFQDLFPIFTIETVKSVHYLTQDKQVLDEFKQYMEDYFKAIEESSQIGDQQISKIEEGEFKKNAKGTWEAIKSLIIDMKDMWRNKTKEAEDKLKQ